MLKLIKFIQETEVEIRKTNWPSREELIRYTWVVIVVSVFLTIVFGGLDYTFTWLADKFLL